MMRVTQLIRMAFSLMAFIPLISSAEVMAGSESSKRNATVTAGGCATCRDMEKLETEFNKLHYSVPAQAKRGEEKLPPVLDIGQRLNSESLGARGGNFYQEFESYVRLAGASLPFDMETQIAADIAMIVIAKDAEEKSRAASDATPTKTQAIYDRVLNSMRDECRKKLLKAVVEERVCRVKAEDAKIANPKCPIAKFSYEDCEAKQKSNP